MPPLPLETPAFLYGLLGSLTVELALVYRAYGKNAKQLPTRYRTPWFWVVRGLLALCSGGVATAYHLPGQAPFLYVHIGAATPLLLLQFAASAPTSSQGRADSGEDE